ncbi:hypothetical protein [Haloferax larsenii]|uniref:Uncharacterized protein n=1 Tax=Haloferax larsenii TaxID=302484 RepID=A0A1H7TQA1_HALLR|nr:hypothetical protein [Haloferax larsenii]SEL86931.1 hypothetical protein SAMN04488691_11012 [Haloferax larsenii]
MGDDPDAEVWDEIGREALAMRVVAAADAVEEAAQPLAHSLHTGGDLTTREVQELQAAVDELTQLTTHLEALSDAP